MDEASRGQLALVMTATGPVPRTDHPLPPRASNEATVRLEVAGVCATDLEIVRGYLGFTGVLGHEFVGVVEVAADPALIGRRVVGGINCPCHRCDMCRADRPTHCRLRSA